MLKQPSRGLLAAVEFPPCGGGGVVRVVKTIHYLHDSGWDMTVVAWDTANPAIRDDSLLLELPEATRVIRVRAPFARATEAATTGAKSRLARRSWLRSALISARSVVRSLTGVPDRWNLWAMRAGRLPLASIGDASVIVSSGPPHSVHLASATLAKRMRIPMVVDIRDEWSTNPLYSSRLPWKAWLDRRLEARVVRQAAAVVLISEVSRDRYAAAYPGRADRMTVIPNGYDPADLVGLDTNHHVPPTGRPIVLGYAGSLHNRRDGRPFFKAFGEMARAAEGRRPLALLMVGMFDEPQEAAARALVPEASLTLMPFVPHRKALELMAGCDALVVLTNEEEAGPAALTGKVFEYLALKRPILAVSPAGACQQLVLESSAGAWADPRDVAGIKSAIEAVVGQVLDPNWTGAPEELLRRYNREEQGRQWAELLDRVAGRSTAEPAVERAGSGARV
jgi:glycosyltransferase involved in cell wall biosynthesis